MNQNAAFNQFSAETSISKRRSLAKVHQKATPSPFCDRACSDLDEIGWIFGCSGKFKIQDATP
jgi:hypothetical protein